MLKSLAEFLAIGRLWISHRPSLRVVVLIACIALAFGRTLVAPKACAAKPNERPNFILLMADDQGWGDVAYNGHPTIKTPNLDRMAAESLRLDRFYAAAPVCSPTRGSVMTGRHPNRFGCFQWGYTLRPEETTIAEALHAAGYATGHFGKWHLGSNRAGSPTSPGENGFEEWLSSPNFYENDPLMSHNGRVVKRDGESSDVAMNGAIEFIRKASSAGRPFLAVVWFGSPHSPHIAADELRELYPDQPAAMQNYLGEITGIDRSVGRLREELREIGIADKTLVWYTSDNGAQGPGSTGGLRGRKGSVWEGGLRVPTIIEWPERIRSPRTSVVPGSTVDIFPTLLELAGADDLGGKRPLDGMSLVPLIDGELKSRNKPLGFWNYPAPGRPVRSHELLAELAKEQEAGTDKPDPLPESAKYDKQYPTDLFPGHSAWMNDRYKLHRIAGNEGATVKYELYDLVADRAEKEDLAAGQPDEVQRMSKELEAWLESVVGSLNGRDYAP